MGFQFAGMGSRVYTVKQVAALTGVTEATLRVWERRYGVVAPGRSPGGYRWYSDDHVGLLREMAQLVHAGVRPSVAAVHVRDMPRTYPAAPAEWGSHDLVRAAAALDPVRLNAVIGEAFATGPFEQVADEWLMPQIAQLGAAWESGVLTIGQEHFASAGLMRAIAAAFDASPEPTSTAPVLVGLPAGARHELGLLCFATCLRRVGVSVIYLGADVPLTEWQRAAAKRASRAAVIGVSLPEAVPEAQAIVRSLIDLKPPMTVWVGGGHRHDVRGAATLPDSVAEAARCVHRGLLGGRI